jgi:hypothetical protein
MTENKESMKNTENNKDQEQNLKELEKKIQQARIKRMVKYSFELKKVGLIDSLRQNIASELVNDKEIEKEIENIMNILIHYLRNKAQDGFSEK